MWASMLLRCVITVLCVTAKPLLEAEPELDASLLLIQVRSAVFTATDAPPQFFPAAAPPPPSPSDLPAPASHEEGELDKSSLAVATKIQRLEPGQVYVMYKHVHLLQEILAKSGVPIWANGGTVLGAVRGQGIIPHDNDADFTIFMQDKEATLDAINSANIGMSAKWNCANKNKLGKNCPEAGHMATDYTDEYRGSKYHSHVGVFLAELLEANRHVGASFATAAANGHAKEKLAFVKSLVPMNFGCSSVLVPGGGDISMIDKYLSEEYGADWNQTVNCAGTMHDCSLPESKKVREWELTHRAEPCYVPPKD